MSRFALLLIAVYAALSQTPTIQIHPGRRVTVPGVDGGIILGQTDCDSAGNIYYRQYIGKDLTHAPLIKIQADGSKSVVFDVGTLNGREHMEGIQVRDDAMDASTVYMLALTNDGKSRILEFSASDGTFSQSIILDGDFTPSKIGVLPPDSFLIYGIKAKIGSAGEQESYEHATMRSIFNQQGKMIKDLEALADDPKIDTKGKVQSESMKHISLSLMTQSPEGLVLLTPSAKPGMYAVGPDGEVTRSFELWTPEEGLRPISIRSQANQVLVEYVRSGKDDNPASLFVVYDVTTGDHLSQFAVAEGVGGIFGCYDFRSSFTFISSEGSNRRVLVRGDAR